MADVRASAVAGSACPASTWRLQLLDAFELRDAAGRLVEPSSTGQRVLAFLALHDRPLHRCHVAGSLWPDSSDARAGASLRSALWRLGKACPGAVQATSSSIGLSSGVAVDMRQLVTISHDLRSNHPPPDPASLVESFERELLADWYDDWVLHWRERWRQTRLHALESLTRLLARTGQFDLAVECGLVAVCADPLRESAHRVLIEAHMLEGNRCEALRQFRAYEALMRTELDLAPAPGLVALIADGEDRVAAGPSPREW